MTEPIIRRLAALRPFRAFDLYLSEGRTVRVKHPEALVPVGDGRSVIVYQTDRRRYVIDLALVVAAEVPLS